ncbi:polyamine ABC transporter permease [Paracoccus versutus]|nr:polyamine ABC transporter permease [Paracoccus versutus]
MSTAFVYVAILFLASPLLAVIPISFTSKRFLSMPDGDWSLRHYQELLSNQQWHDGILTSVTIAALAAILATVFATLFCIGIWYVKSRFTHAFVGIVLAPLAVPPIISALALYFFVTRTNTFDTLLGVVISHAVMSVPYAVVTLLVTLSQVDRRIELAARNLGASVWQTTFWVVLPNIRFGVLTAAFLSFVMSWEEIAVTLFVTSVKIVTLPRMIWAGLRDNVDPVIAAISVALILLTVLGMVLKLIAELRAGPRTQG